MDCVLPTAASTMISAVNSSKVPNIFPVRKVTVLDSFTKTVEILDRDYERFLHLFANTSLNYQFSLLQLSTIYDYYYKIKASI